MKVDRNLICHAGKRRTRRDEDIALLVVVLVDCHLSSVPFKPSETSQYSQSRSALILLPPLVSPSFVEGHEKKNIKKKKKENYKERRLKWKKQKDTYPETRLEESMGSKKFISAASDPGRLLPCCICKCIEE